MRWTRAFAVALLFFPLVARPHSASDAYLTLKTVKSTAAQTRVEVQWDIALRDLHVALALDDDGDGNLTWGEVRKHAARIARHAHASLRTSGDGKACAIEPGRQAIATHADGAYAALFFTIVCDGAPRKLALDYRLFFAIDPSHRGIVVFNGGGAIATALLSPDNPQVQFALPGR